MTLHTTAGSKLFIGGVIDTDAVLNEASFTAQIWVEIKELEAIGSLGDSSQAVDVSVIGRSRDITVKGTRSAGTMECVALIVADDAGQLAAIAAEKTSDNYAFKLVLNDAPAGGTPSERKFGALVMSASEAFDQANSIMKLNISLTVNSNVVRLAAAEE